MASSSAPQDVQRENARFQQDTRPISFFGKVKSYITAPFSWLMGTNEDTNDYEERDGAGKRKRSPMAPSEPTEEEEAQHLGTKRAPIKRVRYQTDHESASLRQEPLSVFASNLHTDLVFLYQCSAFRVHPFLAFRFCRCPVFRFYECPVFCVYECPVFCVYECPVFCVYECPVFRVYSYLAFRVFPYSAFRFC